jgi:hypothetical protein
VFWNRKKSTIHVEFVDNATNAVFASVDLSPDQLPASFEAETTMHLGDQDWLVVSATPMTAVEFRASRRLRVVMNRVKRAAINTSEVLFSLPTISERVPAPADGTTKLGKRVLELHEDDWRQIEFYAEVQEDLVDRHIAAVREIHSSARSGPGFKRIHVRSGCDGLLGSVPLPLSALRAACPPRCEWLEGIALHGLAGTVSGSFAVQLPSSATLYGMARSDVIDVLAVQPRAGTAFDPASIECVTAFLRERHLGVVQWCAATRSGPSPGISGSAN